MSLRKFFLQRLIILLLHIVAFYYAFWIFWDIGFQHPMNIVLIKNVFNILALILCIYVEATLWLAMDSPEFRRWLTSLERGKKKKALRKKPKKEEQAEEKPEEKPEQLKGTIIL